MQGSTIQTSDNGIFAPVAATMKVDFLCDGKGSAWILHDKPLPDILHYIEFDSEAETLTLVMRSGRIQDLGLKVPSMFKTDLEKASTVTVMYLVAGEIQDFAMPPLFTR